MGKSADNIASREQVYQQMLAKFPAANIAWVRTVSWSGPAEVALDLVNDDDKDTWKASHDPHKVEKDRASMHANTAKSIILVKPPNGKLDIIDGHHRFLAAESDGRTTVLAWTARVPDAVGPWSETHAAQIGGPSN